MAEGEADVGSEKVVAPPMVAPHTQDLTVEEMKREVEKIQSQIDGHKTEMERLRKLTEDLKRERVVESELFLFSRELVKVNLARGLTPLSSAEKAQLEEMQRLARCRIDDYLAAKDEFPAYVNRIMPALERIRSSQNKIITS